MPLTVRLVRNVAFAGLVIGVAVQLAPLITNPVERARVAGKLWRPPPPFAAPAPPSAPPAQRDAAAGTTAPSVTSDADNNRGNGEQPPLPANPGPPSPPPPPRPDMEFGPDEPKALALEKELFDAKAPTDATTGSDAVVKETIVYRDGGDVTSTVKGVIKAGTVVNVIGVGDLGFLLVKFNGGGERGTYIYGAALRPVGSSP